MFGDNKYSNVLTIILVIVIIAIIVLLVFLGIDIYTKYYITREAEEAANQFNDEFGNNLFDNSIWDGNFVVNDANTENTLTDNDPLNLLNNGTTTQTNTNSNTNKNSNTKYYKGFVMKGTIVIPKTDVNLPILANAGKDEIEVAVGILYGVGLNKIGNTVISGHNYRNGQFFSNNKKLEIGDKVNITSEDKKITYTIYRKFETDAGDTSFYNRDTEGKCEITLTTCTDNDASRRLILLAKED